MDRIQVTVVEWVSLRPIFDVFARDTGYEGGGRLRVPWRRKEAADNQLKVTLEVISEAARVRRQQESGRCGGRKGGSEARSTNREGWG